jgi:hypothetical protein
VADGTEASSSPKRVPEVFHHTHRNPSFSSLSLVSAVWSWGYREGRLLKLAVKIRSQNFPVAKGALQMHSALPRRCGLGILAQIGRLSQVEFDQLINQVLDVRCM